MSEQIVVKFPEADPKKNSIRYNSDDPRCQSIYISRLALQATFGKEPQGIKLTIEALDE